MGRFLLLSDYCHGCPVSADKNHQTGRYLPLKFRFDVAMSGRLGMEMQPEDMTETDKEFTQRAIQAYKRHSPDSTIR